MKATCSVDVPEVVIAECRHEKNGLYDFMLPSALLRRWKASYLSEESADEEVQLCLKKLHNLYRSMPVFIEAIKLERTVVLFKVNKQLLFKTIIFNFAKLSSSSVQEGKSNSDKFLICYLSDNATDSRILSVASLYECSQKNYLFISRQATYLNADYINETLQLKIPLASSMPGHHSISAILNVFQKSEFFDCKYDDVTGNNNQLIFNREHKVKCLKCRELLHKVDSTKFSLDAVALTNIAKLFEIVLHAKVSEQGRAMLVNIAAQSKALYVYQFTLAFLQYCHLKYNAENAVGCSCLDLVSLLLGPVHTTLSVQDIFEKCKQDVTESYTCKYNVHMNWLPLVDELSRGILKLSLLMISPSSPINFGSDPTTSNVSSVFMLYNYSRLASLLDTHKQRVICGVYPPLPPVEDVDVTLLCEDDEKIILDLLWQLPDEIVEPAEMFPSVTGTKIEDLQPKWLVVQEMQNLAPKCFFQTAEIVFVPDESPFVAIQPDQRAEA
ncbi:unnamed protein product [Clavelina lepadiformis]|uniref:Uncharacterized protein n=1 Tax=Clavelina lepadiformis TaxID=159417 RepID=A0ABP0F9Y2_CLALP